MAEVIEAPRAKANEPQVQTQETTSLAGRDAQRAERLARRTSSLASAGGGGPFAFIRRFAEEMDRLVEDFGVGHGLHLPPLLTRGHELMRREAGLVEAEWSPQVDVKEQDGRLLVRADLPGLSKDDIKVEMTDDTLHDPGGDGRTRRRRKAPRGTPTASAPTAASTAPVPLPEGADTTKVTAQFHNGVLEVSVPAPPLHQSQTRRVEVREKNYCVPCRNNLSLREPVRPPQRTTVEGLVSVSIDERGPDEVPDAIDRGPSTTRFPTRPPSGASTATPPG